MTVRTRLIKLEREMVPPAEPLVILEDDKTREESIAQAKRLGRAVIVASHIDINL